MSWLQSAHPLFVLLLAPFVTRLRGGVTTKVAGSLGVAGLSFVVMAGAAFLAREQRVSVAWLIGVYLLYSLGEIVLAPAGLALAAAVAPPGFANRFLALNGMFAAVGVVLGGQLYRLTSVLPLPVYFLLMGTAVLAIGAALAARAPRLRRCRSDGASGPDGRGPGSRVIRAHGPAGGVRGRTDASPLGRQL